ncbi:MAG TPA: hypothetical protein PK156_33705 [Polyangium sp.]|nr:hypothetical protein [Polyangium sp.]
MADQLLLEARNLDKKIEADKKRAAASKKRAAKKGARKSPAKGKAPKKRTNPRRSCPTRGSVVKLAPDIELHLKSHKYKVVEVHEPRKPKHSFPAKPITTTKKRRNRK